MEDEEDEGLGFLEGGSSFVVDGVLMVASC